MNGPEVLSKYVGQSEENIRNLFADADSEYAERGDDSDLHIIIFDEIDSVCMLRGSHSARTLQLHACAVLIGSMRRVCCRSASGAARAATARASATRS